MTETLLERLFQERPTLPFRPGLSAADLEALRDEIGVAALPAGLEGLYGWKDPPEHSAVNALESQDTWFLLSSARVVAAHRELRDRFSDTGRALYDPRWVPFLRNGSGDYLCAMAGGDPAGGSGRHAPGVVLEVSQSTGGRPVRFGGVTRWLELTVEGLERDLLRLEEDGGLRPVDPIGWEAFLDENNPGFVNGDPAPFEITEGSPGAPSLLRRLATGLGTFSIVALAVTVKVFRNQLPRAGFLAILLGLSVAGLFLLAAQVIVWRNRSPESRVGEPVAGPIEPEPRETGLGHS